jgi:excisionase family DNA binding protein
MKIDEACKYAGGVSRKTVYAAIRAGRLEAARIGAGRNLVVSDVAIDRWLGQSRGASNPTDALAHRGRSA